MIFRSKHYKSKRRSPRKKEIDKVLTLIRKINNIKYKNCCFFCGRPAGNFPLSNCHVFSVGSAPGMELTIENIVPACWSQDFRYRKCHNLWEHRDPKYRLIFEQKLKDAFGKDYFEKLYIMKRTLPQLNMFRIMAYKEHYESLLDKLNKNGIL